MKIQVVYAMPDEQTVIDLEVPQGTTVEAAILQSKICEKYPDIDITKQKVGIFSEIVPLDTVLEAGDRVEIYRLLYLTPMEARRLRASRAGRSSKPK